MRIPKILSAITLGLALGFISQAQAYDLVTSPKLTGDWGGTRTSLSQKGVDLTIGYVGEVAHNYSGGKRQMTDYADQYTFGAELNSDKLGLWHGADVAIFVTDRNGNNLGADAGIGNNMLLQEVYGRGQTWHFTRFSINQKFFADSLELKVGRLTLGEDFASFGCDFQNLSFCGGQPGNLVGNYWLNWPTSVWATRVKYHFTNEVALQIGAYQENPSYVNDRWAQRYGWTLNNPDGSTGTLIPVEFDWTPTLSEQPGIYRIGAWYNTKTGTDLGDPDTRSQRYGFYLSIEQQLTGTKQFPGLGVFLNATQTDPKTAATDRQISLGMQYHGPFARVKDAIGFAVGATHNNSRYANYVLTHVQPGGQTQVVGDRDEYATELFYGYMPIASVTLRPNVQYVVQPGGSTSNPNALVAGLKSIIAF